MLLDSAAAVNVVDKRFAIENNLLELYNHTLLTLRMPNSTKTLSYCAFAIPVRAKDSWNKERTVTITCYTLTDLGTPIILGMLGLKQGRILLDCDTKEWRWKLDRSTLRLDSALEFAENLEEASTVFAVLVTDTGKQP
jgi:hypothetical protein